jgi:hypothetical protein
MIEPLSGERHGALRMTGFAHIETVFRDVLRAILFRKGGALMKKQAVECVVDAAGRSYGMASIRIAGASRLGRNISSNYLSSDGFGATLWADNALSFVL